MNKLFYYSFDWDDNLLSMPTEIILLNSYGEEIGINTKDFSKHRNDVGVRPFVYNGHTIVGYPIKNDNIDLDSAFRNFSDDYDPEVFLRDTIKALDQKSYAPAWSDFIECLLSGSIFAIITARGHESPIIRKAVEYIVDSLTMEQKQQMYSKLLKYIQLFNSDKTNYDRYPTGVFTEMPLVDKYLNSCMFVGVSSAGRGGQSIKVEEAKGEVLLAFKKRINTFAERVGMKAVVGFSDDDLKNVKHINDLIGNMDHEEFPHIIEFIVKNTNNPMDIITTIAKKFNGDDVNVEDCLYKGKKKYNKTINWDGDEN